MLLSPNHSASGCLVVCDRFLWRKGREGRYRYRQSLRMHYFACTLARLTASFSAEDFLNSLPFREALPLLLPQLRELDHPAVPLRPVHHCVELGLYQDA